MTSIFYTIINSSFYHVFLPLAKIVYKKQNKSSHSKENLLNFILKQ